MVTGYEVGMYRDIGLIAQAMRGVEDQLTRLVDINTSLAQEVGRLADAREKIADALERADEDS